MNAFYSNSRTTWDSALWKILRASNKVKTKSDLWFIPSFGKIWVISNNCNHSRDLLKPLKNYLIGKKYQSWSNQNLKHTDHIHVWGCYSIESCRSHSSMYVFNRRKIKQNSVVIFRENTYPEYYIKSIFLFSIRNCLEKKV